MLILPMKPKSKQKEARPYDETKAGQVDSKKEYPIKIVPRCLRMK